MRPYDLSDEMKLFPALIDELAKKEQSVKWGMYLSFMINVWQSLTMYEFSALEASNKTGRPPLPVLFLGKWILVFDWSTPRNVSKFR